MKEGRIGIVVCFREVIAYVPDRADPEYRHGRIRFDFACIPHGTQSGRDATTEQARLGQVGVFINFGTRNFRYDGIFTHRTATVDVWGIFGGIGWDVLYCDDIHVQLSVAAIEDKEQYTVRDR